MRLLERRLYVMLKVVDSPPAVEYLRQHCMTENHGHARIFLLKEACYGQTMDGAEEMQTAAT
jgi:hypothetical protein